MGRTNNYTIKAAVVKSEDLFTNPMEPRIESLERELHYLIGQGYISYDVTLSGGFAGLNTVDPGSYVCVWTGARADSYSLTLAHITRHTSVVILNAEVNTSMEVTNIVTNTFSIPDGDYTGKLRITGGYYYIYAAAAVSNIRLDGGYHNACAIAYINQAAIVLTNSYIRNTYIKATQNITLNYSTAPTAGEEYIKNSIIEETSGGLTISMVISATSSLEFINGLHVNLSTATGKLLISAAAKKVFNFSAFKLVNPNFNFILQMDKVYSDNGSFFYSDSVGITRIGGTSSKSWQAIPSAGSSASNADYIDIGFDENGVLYRAYQDHNTADKLTVDKYVSGASWTNVGGVGISAAAATHISMYIVSSSEIYVAYSDGNASGKVTVKKWNGSSWATLGSAGFSASAATYIIIDCTFGYPYVVYKNTSNYVSCYLNPAGSWIKKSWDSGTHTGKPVGLRGNNCAILGTDGYIGFCTFNTGPSNDENYTDKGASKAGAKGGYSTGTYFDIVYIKSSTNKISSARMYLNTWAQYGSEDFSGLAEDYCDIALDGSIPIVAYQDSDAADKATVMQYDGVSAWSLVGTAGVSAGVADFLCLLDRNSIPYIAYKDGGTTSKFTALKYTDSGVTLICNYPIKYSRGDFYRGEFGLDYTILEDQTDYVDQDLLLRPVNELGFVKTPVIKNNFSLEFDPSYYFDDSLKQIGAEDVIKTEITEFETALIGKTIQNLALYDGADPYDFDNNENFIIIATSSENTGIFVYYNKKIWKTIYADSFPGTVYTITGCYQIYRPKAALNIYNKFQSGTNSPTGESSEAFPVDNIDNEIIIE